MTYIVIWIAALVAFLIVEAVTYQMITVWFGVGALFSALCAVAEASLNVQITVFLIVSIVTLCLFRPLAMRHFKTKTERTNVDSLIGKTVTVTQKVTSQDGKGKINGMEWTLRCDDGVEIEEGERVVVEKIEGVKLMVKKG